MHVLALQGQHPAGCTRDDISVSLKVNFVYMPISLLVCAAPRQRLCPRQYFGLIHGQHSDCGANNNGKLVWSGLAQAGSTVHRIALVARENRLIGLDTVSNVLRVYNALPPLTNKYRPN